MRVVYADTVRPFGLFDTVIVFEGDDVESGDRVVFAADHRPARDIRAAIDDGDTPTCEVPEWMVLS